jgi:hypothetical protein
MNRQRSYDDLFALALASPVVGPAPNGAPQPAANGAPLPGRSPHHVHLGGHLKQLKIEVLGHYPNGNIDIFSRLTGGVFRINNIHRLGYPELVLYCGQAALDNVHAGRDQVSGRITLEEIKNAIALFASENSLADCAQMGNGVWMINGQITLVNGRCAGVYDPAANAVSETSVPRVGRHILDFSASDGWVHFPTLRNYLAQAASPAWCEQVIKDTETIFAKWYWPHPADALLAACLVVCSWVQTVWPWRPQVVVTGGSASGKTILFQTLKSIFNRLGNFHEKPTEAYLRQSMRSRACVVGIDEFEHDYKRQHALEMIRVSSAGGEIGRGTADQRGRKFPLRHLLWMAGIESGLHREADRNRCIVLDLQRPPPGKRGVISLPPEPDLADLGVKQLAVALRHVLPAVAVFSSLKSAQIPGVPGRLVESFSVPAALLASVRCLAPAAARPVLEDFFRNRPMHRHGGADETDLLKAIMDGEIRIGRGEFRSVSEIIGSRSNWLHYRLDLERHGVALIPAGPALGEYDWSTMRLFFDAAVIRRYLLRRSPWAELDCEQLLERLPGSRRVQCTIARLPRWGVAVPLREYAPDPDEESGVVADAGPVSGELVRNR